MTEWKQVGDGAAVKWVCDHGKQHDNAVHDCDGCCNDPAFPGMAERIRNNTNFTELAFPPPINKRVYKESEEHRRWVESRMREGRHISMEEYNYEVMQAKSVFDLPPADRVLVIGAGPSLTMEAIERERAKRPDVVLITLPLIRALEHMLDDEGVYVVDSEREMFIVPHYYGPHHSRVRLLTTSVKHLEACRPFRSLHVYNRVKLNWPWTSGAIALQLALDVFKAKHIDVLGIDLSGRYVKFIGETQPLLNRVKELEP